MADHLVKARKVADGLHKHGWLNSFCYYFDNGETQLWGHQPCYGVLFAEPDRYWTDIPSRPRNSKCLFFIDWPLNTCAAVLKDKKPHNGLTYDQMVEYVHYLTHESPMAHAYVDKDPVNVLTHGTIIDANCPLRMVITAAIAVRYIAEFPARVITWHTLKKYMSKNAAFVFMHYFRNTGNGLFKFGNNNTGHSLFDYCNPTMITNFISGNWIAYRNTIPASQKWYGYEDLRCLWTRDKSKYDKVNSIPGKIIDMSTDWNTAVIYDVWDDEWFKAHANELIEANTVR